MKAWIERAGYERVVVVTEQVPEAEMRADETFLLHPADNHHAEEAVQHNNEARAEESCAAFDHLIDAYYVNNTIKHAITIMNGTPNLEAEVGMSIDEVMTPLVPYRDNEEAAAQQQNYAPQQQQGTFALLYDPNNDNINSAPDHMHFEPNTVFYRKFHTSTSRLHRFYFNCVMLCYILVRSDSSQHIIIFICVFLSADADKYKHVDKYTAAAQFGSFGLHSESSGPGMLKKGDPEMRQLYLDLAMLVC
jgi:hypothetical protein